MKMIFAAVALSIAVPAFAQDAPAPTPVEAKKGCCADMKAKMDCCKDMAKDMGDDKSHGGHDMKPSTESHPGHQ